VPEVEYHGRKEELVCLALKEAEDCVANHSSFMMQAGRQQQLKQCGGQHHLIIFHSLLVITE
jgi:hypothetical protein